MEFKSDNVPDDVITEALNEMKNEIEMVGQWYEASTASIKLVKESAERQLKPHEAAKVGGDFLMAGLLLRSLSERNRAIIESGFNALAMVAAESLDEDIKKFMKGN